MTLENSTYIYLSSSNITKFQKAHGITFYNYAGSVLYFVLTVALW